MLKRSVASDGFLFVSHRKSVKGMILLASVCVFCCYLVSFLLISPRGIGIQHIVGIWVFSVNKDTASELTHPCT